jgi:anti-sigma factor RsiW
MPISCDQNPITLASYLDGELAPDQIPAMHQHIATCPQCAIEIAELTRQKQSLRAARNHYTPTLEFRKKMQQQFAPPRRPRTSILRFIPAALAIAAMLLLAFTWTQHSRRQDAFSEVADLHVNALASTNPLDVISTDRHTVKPWFQGRIPFSFNVPELTGTEFTLLGGRVVYLHQQPGAQLIVAMRQHKISVLIFQASPGLALPFPVSSGASARNSFTVETWQSQGLRFLVIGDVDPTEIERLAQSLKQANG